MNGTQTLTISQLRQNAATIIKSVAEGQNQAVILQRSRPRAILVDIGYFQALEQAVLDLADSREADRAKAEKRTSFDAYVKKRWGSGTV